MQSRLKTTAAVLRVIDGDTILAQIECPCCKITSQQRIRLARIDAPELQGAARGSALLSRDFLRNLIEKKTVEICVTRTWPDKYGRVLAEIWHENINISDKMLRAGHAKKWTQNNLTD